MDKFKKNLEEDLKKLLIQRLSARHPLNVGHVLRRPSPISYPCDELDVYEKVHNLLLASCVNRQHGRDKGKYLKQQLKHRGDMWKKKIIKICNEI